MQTQFIKESMNYYFVVERNEQWVDNYEEKLFRVCDVPYFLPYEIREINGVSAIYYKMSYRTTLKQAFECVSFTADKIDNIIRSIIGVLEACEEYLVLPDNILFDSEYVFFDINTGKLRFCYHFEKEEGMSLKELVMEMLQHVDKRHESGAIRLLKFYNLITEPECTVEGLKNFNNSVIEDLSVDTIVEADDTSGIINDQAETVESEKKGVGISFGVVKLLKLLMLITTIMDVALLIGLICNVLTYEKMGYLFIGMAFLIGLVIIYMHFEPDEETPDEMMEEYRKSIEKTDNAVNFVNNRIENEIDEPATILLSGERERNVHGIEEKYHSKLFLEAMEKERYCPIHIASNSLVLGSMQGSCDYVLAARGISRLHAKLFDKNDGMYIMDMNSTNGTYINGEMLQAGIEYKVEEGDLISFAGVQYYVLQEG